MRWQLNSTPGPSQLTTTGPAGADQGNAEPPRPAITLNRFERVLEDEENYQALQYPKYEDLPGCMRLFDEFMMCYALVPQLRSFYRRGEFNDCSWKFRDFKYCLSLKSESEENRRELWIKRRAEWWAKRRVSRSSEDVWDVRTTPLENFPPAQVLEEAPRQ